MVNNRKKILTAKYMALVLLSLLLAVLQTTPGFLVFFGVKPTLLIPAAVTLAMYEGEFSGGLFGMLAGMFCDLQAFSLYGLYSVLLLCCGAATGLLVIYLMRRTLRVAVLLTAATATLLMLARFYVDYGMWGYAGMSHIFWRQAVPGAVLTTAVTPLFFWLFGKLEIYFVKKINV